MCTTHNKQIVFEFNHTFLWPSTLSFQGICRLGDDLELYSLSGNTHFTAKSREVLQIWE